MRKSGKPKSRVRLAWDEDNLEYLEATRTPKQKITEPKTPYHAPEDSDGPDESAVDAAAVSNALSNFASTSNNANGKRWHRASGGWTSSEDDEMDYEEEHDDDRRRFKELRRAHYDEFHKLKMLRSQGVVSDFQEEENLSSKIPPSLSFKEGKDEEMTDERVCGCSMDIQ